jgi:hypothetical protein
VIEVLHETGRRLAQPRPGEVDKLNYVEFKVAPTLQIWTVVCRSWSSTTCFFPIVE